MSFKPGDHILTSRGVYTHHGIVLNATSVIHYLKTGVIKSNLQEFAKGAPISLHPTLTRTFTHNETVYRAKSRLGENNYNLIFNNCECFANWCVQGLSYSGQVWDAAFKGYEATLKMKNKYQQPLTNIRSHSTSHFSQTLHSNVSTLLKNAPSESINLKPSIIGTSGVLGCTSLVAGKSVSAATVCVGVGIISPVALTIATVAGGILGVINILND